MIMDCDPKFGPPFWIAIHKMEVAIDLVGARLRRHLPVSPWSIGESAEILADWRVVCL
jgi:hypothetical protein